MKRSTTYWSLWLWDLSIHSQFCFFVFQLFCCLFCTNRYFACIIASVLAYTHKRFTFHWKQDSFSICTVPLQLAVTKEERVTVQDLSSQHCECIHRLFYILACFTLVVNKSSYNDSCYYCMCFAILSLHFIQAPNLPYQSYWGSHVLTKEWSTFLWR